MPGTIQVTVLEFKGVSSSSKPSAKSLKVWMGKRQYQTWDKGDFYFPITKIGENLVVALLDAGGNEIALQEIGTMEIVEKGYWDEVFSINGGGHVHLKLQFALSEDDRNRIRIMRESAMKKKLETNSNIKPRLSEAIASASDSEETSTKNELKVSEIDVVEASQTGSATSSTVSLSTKQGGSILQSSITNAISVVSKLQDNCPSNVRKMINAFENTQLQNTADMDFKQEVKSLKKASSVPSQLNRLRKGGLLENPESNVERSLRDFKDETTSKRIYIISSDHESSQAPKEMSSANDFSRQYASETATSSGRLLEEEQTRVTQSHESENSSTESSLGEGGGSGTGLSSSTMSMAKNPGPKTLEYYKEECSGMWIFPDNTRRLCITTKMVGHHHNEAKTRVKKTYSESLVLEQNVMHGTEFEKDKNQKTIVQQPESESGTSPDRSSNGLVGQVIKIAAIIGFGVLVLLTRQKEPRKKHREENGNLFLVPEYVDDTTLKPWTVKQ